MNNNSDSPQSQVVIYVHSDDDKELDLASRKLDYGSDATEAVDVEYASDATVDPRAPPPSPEDELDPAPTGEGKIRLRRRHWRITWFGQGFNRMDISPFPDLTPYRDTIRYAVWQKEKCGRTGRLHWQAYIEFEKPVGISYIKKQIFKHEGVHCQILDARKGATFTRNGARDYCMKVPTRVERYQEFGKWVEDQRPGKRTDLDAVHEAIQEGKRLRELSDEHGKTIMRYPSGVREMLRMQQQEEGITKRALRVRLYCGVPGAGKTRAAMREAKLLCNGDMNDVYILDDTTGGKDLWWDGYDGQKCLIIDDYQNWIPISLLKRILDIYPLRLNQKGSSTYARFTDVWITTNLGMDDWTDKGKHVAQVHLDALLRRIHVIREYTDLHQDPIVHKDVPHRELEISDDEC